MPMPSRASFSAKAASNLNFGMLKVTEALSNWLRMSCRLSAVRDCSKVSRLPAVGMSATIE